MDVQAQLNPPYLCLSLEPGDDVNVVLTENNGSFQAKSNASDGLVAGELLHLGRMSKGPAPFNSSVRHSPEMGWAAAHESACVGRFPYSANLPSTSGLHPIHARLLPAGVLAFVATPEPTSLVVL
ncbi:hypothetical protein U9M48_006046 [Paspalum notatum var. saurae]|uniref:Uncharacterized protein n=1 Tax=Paspalum notatum var. saurae TaxID=547442 RepID=A0AAQ3SLL7_PASNO